jgi:hypothetical protein
VLQVMAKDAKSSLLYGELLPRGINKAMCSPRLGGERASVVYELGMGIGKVAVQVFLQFRNLTRVLGVELSVARSVSWAEMGPVRTEAESRVVGVRQVFDGGGGGDEPVLVAP